MKYHKFWLGIFFIFIFSCIEKKDPSQYNRIDFDTIIENDTISISSIPKNLTTWISFYNKTDTLFDLTHFKASGVILHMSDLQITDPLTELNWEPLFEFSPDKKRYLDLWSYGKKNIPKEAWQSRTLLAKTLTDGEADQQVVLGIRNSSRYELLFNGPTSYSEMAAWINNEQFLISLASKDKSDCIFELFIFDIKQNLFTNYRLDHPFPGEIKMDQYIEYWLNESDNLLK